MSLCWPEGQSALDTPIEIDDGRRKVPAKFSRLQTKRKNTSHQYASLPLSNMIQTALIRNAHQDLVADAAYDMYGLSLATCGLDQRIKVWSLDENSGNWVLEDEWKAHEAAITKIDWAHAEFGQIIATSSFDRTVRIWEQVIFSQPETNANGAGGGGASSSVSPGPNAPCRWEDKATLMEAKGSVRAVQFAPHHFGLKLASISTDNLLRIYECLEQPSLSSWQLADEVDVLGLPNSAPRASSLSQSLATTTPTQTTLTLDGTATTSLTASLLAAQQQQQQSQAPHPNRPGAGVREADGGWCLAWCKDRYWGEIIAVGAGTSGVIRIIQFSSHRRPQTLLALEAPAASFSSGISNSLGRSGASSSSHPRSGATNLAAGSSGSAFGGGASSSKDDDEHGGAYSVTSVAWAPSCGRSFHLIATGSRDGKVRIWKVKPPPPSSYSGGASGNFAGHASDQDMSGDALEERWTASLVGEFDDHKTHVGRVEWNITGTILASSGNDGRVRLWKQTVGGIWRAAGHVSVEQTEASAPGADIDMVENTGPE